MIKNKKISFEPFVITPKEYKNLLKRGHPFLIKIRR